MPNDHLKAALETAHALVHAVQPLPCPHCGSKPEIIRWSSSVWIVSCTLSACNAAILANSQAAVVKSWNRRAP